MPLELTAKNFTVNRDSLILTTKHKGYTLVFFKTTSCPGCSKFAPTFEQLERESSGVLNFAIIDVSKHRNVLNLARSTKTPIPSVPHLLLYAGSTPYARYTGNLGITSLRSFISKVLDSTQASNTFTPTADIRQNRSRGNYAIMGQQENEEEDISKLICPTNVIPHNAPWVNSQYRKMELEIQDQ